MKKNLLHRSLSRGVTSGSSSSGSYTVNLNGQWEQTTAVSNPDSSVYDGVFRSASNYNVNSGVATMYITIKDYSSFKMYIRSYAESNYDYVMVSQLDKTITGSSSYSDTTLVKAHTRGNQQSGTAIGNYTLVEFTGISSGEHTITVVYRKDSSVNNGDDRGYLLINKHQEGIFPDEEPEEPEGDEEIPEIGVYIVDKDEVLWEVNDWTGGDSAIGVGLVAGNHRFMIAKADATDGTNSSLYFNYSNTTPTIPKYSMVDAINDEGYLPNSNGQYENTPHLSGNFTTWTTGALSDFMGKANTAAIASKSTNSRDMCKVLETFNAGTNTQSNEGFNDWYIPSCGQLSLISIARNDINTALVNIGGNALGFSYSYWSSSMSDTSYAWYVTVTAGFVKDYHGSGNSRSIRFIRDLSNSEPINFETALNGIYAVTSNGNGLLVEKADDSCIGIALITDNQRIMIAKNDTTGGVNDTFRWFDMEYDLPLTNYFNNGTTDFAGKLNSEILQQYGGNYTTIGKALSDYNRSDSYGDWYIPACGQLYEIAYYIDYINKALQIIGGTPFKSERYWSSTEHSKSQAFYALTSSDTVSKQNLLPIRFVRDL